MIASNQRSAGEAIACAKSLVAPPCLQDTVTHGMALVSGGLAAAPLPRTYRKHEHAELGQTGPEAQSIGPENTATAKSSRDALTSRDGNGKGQPRKASRSAYPCGRSARVS